MLRPVPDMFRYQWLLRSLLPLLIVAHPASAQTAKNSSSDTSRQGFVIEHAVTKARFEADGTSTRETSAAIRIQEQAGVERFAVLSFAYTAANESVEVSYVRVRKPDGTVVNTPPDYIQDMPADVTRTAPMYSDIHEKHVPVKGLGVGDTLEYDVRFRVVHPEVPGQFWLEYSFAEDAISEDEELEVDVPGDKYVKVSSPALPPKVTEQGGRKIFTWKTTNPKIADHENELPREKAGLPSVQVTSFRNWEEVGSWFEQLAKPQAAVTPELRAQADALVKGKASDEDKIRALYEFVSTHVHYISLSFGIGRYQPHVAHEVLENEYGDCKDKHTLLAALLGAEGYEADAALVNANRKIDPDVPSPGQFNHVITAVRLKGSTVWLDTTTEVAPFQQLIPRLRGAPALLVAANGAAALVRTPEQLPYAAQYTFSATGKLSSDDTFSGHIERSSRGDVELLLRIGFRSTPQVQWQNLAQRMSYLSNFAGDISNLRVSPPEETAAPFNISYDYVRKKFGDWDNHRITPPLPPFGLESLATEDKNKPVEPYFLGAPGVSTLTAKVDLPAGYRATVPKDADVVEDFLEYHSRYSVKGGVLSAERRLVIKQAYLPVREWDALRKFAKAISDDEDQWVHLEGEAGGPSAPAAEAKYKEGYDAYDRGDFTGSEEAFRNVVKLDPKFRGVHRALASLAMRRGDTEAAITELEKEEELHPEETQSYRMLASLYLLQKRKADATEQMRKLVKSEPGNVEATVALVQLLNEQKNYPEAVQTLQNAVKLKDDSMTLRILLGEEYVQAGQTDKGVTELRKCITADASAEQLNEVAYALADANVDLDESLLWAQKAVAKIEAESAQASSPGPPALRLMNDLAADWDTLGWVYFRRGDYDKAVAYLKAAWGLSQDPLEGDHLGQAYEQQHKKQAAIHAYSLALAVPSPDADTEEVGKLRQHYKAAAGEEWSAFPMVALRRRSDGTFPPSPGEELSRMRTVKLTQRDKTLRGTSYFWIEFGPPGTVRSVLFDRGDESLKKLTKEIQEAKFAVDFPDAGPAKIVRSAMVMCGSECTLVLMPLTPSPRGYPTATPTSP